MHEKFDLHSSIVVAKIEQEVCVLFLSNRQNYPVLCGSVISHNGTEERHYLTGATVNCVAERQNFTATE